jgi:hypothetical protein
VFVEPQERRRLGPAWGRPSGEKTSLYLRLIQEMTILPRQARDKLGKTHKKGSLLLFAGELDSLAFLSEVDAASAAIEEHSDCVCGAQQKGVNLFTLFCCSWPVDNCLSGACLSILHSLTRLLCPEPPSPSILRALVVVVSRVRWIDPHCHNNNNNNNNDNENNNDNIDNDRH